MFHGPVKEAVPFFESMGFRCPERKDHASFLQEVTTPKGKLLLLLCSSIFSNLTTKVSRASRSERLV